MEGFIWCHAFQVPFSQSPLARWLTSCCLGILNSIIPSFHHSAFPDPLLVALDCFSLLRFRKFKIFWCRKKPLGIDIFGLSGHSFEQHKSLEQLVYARGCSFRKIPCRSIWADILNRPCYIEVRNTKLFFPSLEWVQSTTGGVLEQAGLILFPFPLYFSSYLPVCLSVSVCCSVCTFVLHVYGHTFMWVHMHMGIFMHANTGGWCHKSITIILPPYSLRQRHSMKSGAYQYG